MRCTIPEISWHNREPVLSVDIHPLSNEFYRLASGGGDSHILIWQMTLCENGSVKQEVISDLTRHQKAVNTVRWSSTGQYLASADDDANIIVWQLKNDNIPSLEGETDDKEVWIVHKVLRGHKEDVYDLCWSADDSKLFSGSIDNTAILWDLSKGKMDHILSDHKGFVQGVAWDPKNQYLATISTDRICRIFDVTGKHVKARINKGKLPVPPEHFLFEKESKYFHDDTFKSFFRRLQFTADGSLLIVPSGHIQADDCKKIINATLIFTMDNWNEPAAVLPLPKQCSTVVRCCPILFEHHVDGPEPLVKTPYRTIFAVGADHDVILYDTQQAVPFAWFHQIHYTRLTDLTWSKDGLLLIASSTDGFCALITFEPGELGKPYVKDDSDAEENPMEVSGCSELPCKDENVDINNKLEKEVEAKKKPSFIAQWAQNTPKKNKLAANKASSRSKINGGDEIIEIIDNDTEPVVLKKEIRIEIQRLIPRRITPTTIISSSENKSVAKPIEVRRKPRDVEAKPIAVRRKPREPDNSLIKGSTGAINFPEMNKETEVEKPRDVKAKPIAVRRKPREADNSLIEGSVGTRNFPMMNKETEVENAESIAKSSEGNTSKNNLDDCGTECENVEKSRSLSQNISNETANDTVLSDSSKESAKSSSKNVEEALSHKKEILSKETETNIIVCEKAAPELVENQDLSRQADIIEIRSENESNDERANDSKKDSTNKKIRHGSKVAKDLSSQWGKPLGVINTPTKTSIKTIKVSKTTPSSSQKPSTGKRKKEDTPKVKVGSLVRKKLNTGTPPKNNPLLNFLKSSGGKKQNVKSTASAAIEIDLTAEEARDAWGKDNKSKSRGRSPEAVVPEEDCTEDFSLQLEDSQDDKERRVAGKEDMEPMEVDQQPMVSEVVDSDKSNKHSSDSIVIDISDDSNDSLVQKKVEDNITNKVPRRVPLITLSSPKDKKKQSKRELS